MADCQRCAGPITGAPFRCHRTNLRLCRHLCAAVTWGETFTEPSTGGGDTIVVRGWWVYAIGPQVGGLRLAYS